VRKPASGEPDDVYAELDQVFDEEEIVALTLAFVASNGWNRFAVGLRTPVGDHVSRYPTLLLDPPQRRARTLSSYAKPRGRTARQPCPATRGMLD
jgi:hypothetical protein